MKILYLVHMLEDAAVRRRTDMLAATGMSICLAGFYRSAEPVAEVSGIQAMPLGQTNDAALLSRIGKVFLAIPKLWARRKQIADTNVIIARNLEVAVLGLFARAFIARRASLVYESLDLHRMLLREDLIGRIMRSIESTVLKRSRLAIVSSPAFIDHHFRQRYTLLPPFLLIENKILDPHDRLAEMPATSEPQAGPPWRIGWFGVIRCAKSLAILDRLTRSLDGRLEVIIRGKPAKHEFIDFDGVIAANPHIRFEGPYRNPDDLERIYSEIHLTWAIDFFEEGQNSSWLLPNRLYEGGYYGSVPVALGSVETGRWLARHGLGLVLPDDLEAALGKFLASADVEKQWQSMRHAMAGADRSLWLSGSAEHAGIAGWLRDDRIREQDMTTMNGTRDMAGSKPKDCPILVVVPCLNEETHLPSVLAFLSKEVDGLQAEIVVADGGSTDRSREIVAEFAARDSRIHLLANPRRIQSSAMNLAVKTFGDGRDYLVRVDAHCGYHPGFVRGLIAAAIAHDACSVVVPMETIGTEPFQRAVAAAQNSKLGNGGSQHRLAAASRYVDHGHHALMSIAAYRAAGGYDETFTHNEDAELDVRLRKAGGKIWLEGTQIIEYYPRKSAGKLLKQYFNYGKGRARNTLKHRTMPKVRQSIPLGVAPAVVLALFSPLWWPLTLPALAWLAVCLGYGLKEALSSRRIDDLLIGPALACMHFGWSAGFFMGMLGHLADRPAGDPSPSLR